MPSACGSTVTHHSRFYDPNGSVIFWVEDTLYKLIRFTLEKDSEFFRQLFDIGAFGQPTTEGEVDENPIIMPAVTVEAFDLYLELRNNW